MELANVTPDHYPDILRLNTAAVPHVNEIGEEELAHLHSQSVFFKAASESTGLLGFLLALDEKADYSSLNFLYFKNRYPRFTYVDRIVVADGRRRTGVGARLYSELISTVAGVTPLISCEVNLEPPNPGSMQFHERLAFHEVDQQQTDGGSKRVSLMVRELPSGSSQS